MSLPHHCTPFISAITLARIQLAEDCGSIQGRAIQWGVWGRQGAPRVGQDTWQGHTVGI
jgi:hypothetical protein